ncbi:MAG: hydantoinase B/oxoprolinase family protein [Caulobacteraceae bacterium]
MSPFATTIAEEGVYIDNVKLVEAGRFREAEMLDLLTSGPWPARNPVQNLNDLKAQVAANQKGADELRRATAEFGLEVVRAYMGHVQDNAAASVRLMLRSLPAQSAFDYEIDQGSVIRVKVSVDTEAGEAVVDFTGTSPQRPDNFNAPLPVTRAAVLYVLRVMVEDDIPMNAGCLRPVRIVAPKARC